MNNGHIAENQQRAADFYQSLGRRQRELVEYMAMGYNNDTIAELMGLKPKTVKNTIRAVFRKMKPSVEEDSRAAAVMLCHVYHCQREK